MGGLCGWRALLGDRRRRWTVCIRLYLHDDEEEEEDDGGGGKGKEGGAAGLVSLSFGGGEVAGMALSL